MSRCLLVFAVILVLCGMAQADAIVLRTGGAQMGQTDSAITVCGADWDTTWAPPDGNGSDQYIHSSGLAAQNPVVVSPVSGYWIDALAGCSWVSPVASGTEASWSAPVGGYLYAMEFELPAEFSNPNITISVASDDNGALYLNGQRFSDWSDFWEFGTFSCADSTAFRPGTNRLEFRNQNVTGPTGLCFTGTVNYTAEPVPEPSTLIALSAFLPTLLVLRRRRP